MKCVKNCGKIFTLLFVGLVVSACVPSTAKLQAMSPDDRAQAVCGKQHDYFYAKIAYQRADEQARKWKRDADNGHRKKRQCNLAITKYPLFFGCNTAYIPINIEFAYQEADRWKKKAEDAKRVVQRKWNACYDWAVTQSPKTLREWVKHNSHLEIQHTVQK